MFYRSSAHSFIERLKLYSSRVSRSNPVLLTFAAHQLICRRPHLVPLAGHTLDLDGRLIVHDEGLAEAAPVLQLSAVLGQVLVLVELSRDAFRVRATGGVVGAEGAGDVYEAGLLVALVGDDGEHEEVVGDEGREVGLQL